MSQGNRRLIEDLYAAFAAGDAGAVLAALDPQVSWWEAENTPYADGNPYVGPAAVAQGVFGRIMSEWEGFAVQPAQYVADGEVVVALGRYTGVYRATGRALDCSFAHVWTLREGRIFEFRQHADTMQFNQVRQPQAAPITA